ncbi:MAG: hypothetical protein U0136_03815 [Bdellovibrionota bacterium]
MGDLIGRIDTNLWTEISAVLFLVCFSAYTFYVFLPGRKPAYVRAEQLPLEVE